MLYTACRIDGEEAYKMALLDVFGPIDQLRDAAMSPAEEIASAPPLEVTATRATADV